MAPKRKRPAPLGAGERAVPRRAGERPAPRGASERPAPRGASERVKLPTLAKGIRPQFYDDPAIDQLFAIVTALTGELSVAFDRLDTLEQVLVQARSLPAGAVASYVAQGADAERRARHREDLLRRVFAVFEAYAERQRPSR